MRKRTKGKKWEKKKQKKWETKNERNKWSDANLQNEKITKEKKKKKE